MPNNIGANTFTAEELEELFRDDVPQETPPADDATPTDSNPNANTGNGDKITETQAFSRRLRESTEKIRKEEREAIAKSLGYESYVDMQRKREQQIYTDKGLNPEDVSPVVEEIVKQRLNNDPRMLELEKYRNEQIKEFGKKELAELSELTDGEITDFSQLPKTVLDKWAERGSLVKAYMEVEGVNLVKKVKSSKSSTASTTSHMKTPTTSAASSNTAQRHLTAQEKQVWKFFNPGMSDEELDKKLVDN